MAAGASGAAAGFHSMAILATCLLCPVPGALANTYHLPLLPSASDALRQGMVRIVNHSAEAGEIAVTAIDDSGTAFGPFTLDVEAEHVIHFSSTDLEQGNATNGIATGVGGGQGDWRLILETGLDIEPLAYVHTSTGFVDAIHDPIPRRSFHHRIPLLAPSTEFVNGGQLRLINASDLRADVVIFGIDGDGELAPGWVSVAMPAGTARTISARQMEAGATGLNGRLGDGAGDWQLLAFTDVAIEVMALLENPSGPLANLSTTVAQDGEIPFFPAAAEALRQGTLRIVNRSGAGEIQIHAVDDAGRRYGPATLYLESGQTVDVSSSDLETGNAAKGLSIGIGSGTGDWRIELQSELDLDAFAYVRTQDAFVTAVDAVAAQGNLRHHVPFFNPASETRQASRLRLINLGDGAADIVVRGWDDGGNTAPNGAVRLALAAGASRSVSAESLENGGEGLTGSLGDGEGRWRLSVQADRDIHVMSLVESSAGHVTNVSSSAHLPKFLNSCVGGSPDIDDDGVSDYCDRDTQTAFRALGQCADGSYIGDPDANPGLVGDCRVLVGFANLQVQSDELPEAHVLRQWGVGEQATMVSWNGIEISGGRVTAIRLPGSSEQPGTLNGFIPPELGQLGNLTVLDLSYNRLSGPIPATLGQLTQLAELDLSYNRLSDRIPSELGELARLVHLVLNNNRLSGRIPAELGKLGSVTDLWLARNRLTGPIPPELGRLGRLEQLWLAENELTGSIPPELGELNSLTFLSVSSNRLAGLIPSKIGNLNGLTTLDLSNNRLTGPIPSEIGKLNSLTHLVGSSNKLTGPIPAELGGLSELNVLEFSRNQLSGSIPSALGALSKLHTLGLFDNRLSGLVPAQLGYLTALRHLNLGNNRLTGAIPTDLGNLLNLRELYLNKNRLTGFVPWAFWERVTRGELIMRYEGNAIRGFEAPPQRSARPVFSENPADNGNATHNSVAYYQGPLVWAWDWRNDAVEHERPVLGRWAALAVRIDHEVREPPLVATRVLDGQDAVLAERLAAAAPPTTVSTAPGQWRTETVFYLPGALHQAGNQVVHEIDPDNELAETDEQDNIGEAIRLYGVESPRFRVTFVPLHFSGEDPPSTDSDSLMAGTRAFWPIGDDYQVHIGSPLESDAADKFELLDEVTALWNAEADPDEFYHGVFDLPWPGSGDIDGLGGGVAVQPGRVAVSEISVHDVIPHEFGHNLSLQHAPGCGAGSIDENYPYPDGALGTSPGWEVNWRRLISRQDEGYGDVMSYCREHSFVSDYHYRKASEYWRSTASATDTSAAHTIETSGGESRWSPASANSPPPVTSQAGSDSAGTGGLALSGRIHASGEWTLTHAQTTEKQARAPPLDGPHTLILIDGDGVELYREPLSVNVFSEGGEAGWAARTPVPAQPAREVAILDAQGVAVLREELPVFE